MDNFGEIVARVGRLQRIADEFGDNVDDLTEEVAMLRQSLKDARRALAMMRGEEWPDDWHYDEGTLDWWSPTWSAVIKRVEADNGGILWDMRVPYPQGWVSVTPMPFPDPLAALRAFEAGGF